MLSVEDGEPGTYESLSPEALRIAEQNGGWGATEEHPGGWAIFRVFLPRYQSQPAVRHA
jgi:hypothetical protein